MNFQFDESELRELVQPIAEEIAAAILTLGPEADRLAYPEAEAARLLGLAKHQLADARRREEITPTKVGGRIGYERSELLAYLVRGRQEAR
ncbi:MAG: helix-turn-helix domain-containing protein [Planctomycetota bacterium]